MIFGWSLGAWSALYYYNCFAHLLHGHLKKLNIPDPKPLFTLAKALFVFLVLLILLFFVRLYSETSEFPPTWLANIKANCNRWVVKGSQEDPADLLRTFEDKDFISSCSYIAVFGAYLSMVFLQPRFFPKQNQSIKPLGGPKYLIYRYSVSLALILPLYMLSNVQTFTKSDDVYIATIGETIIPYFVASVIFFTFSNEINKKL